MTTSIPFVPLRAIQAWYDDTPAILTPSLYFLDSSVTTMLDSYTRILDLPGRLATTGAYNSATGIPGGDWPLNYDTDTGVLEVSLPASTWVSTNSFTLTFRWIAIALTGGALLDVIDFGTAQALAAVPLSLYAAESTYIPGSYPIFRWRKT